MILFSHVHVHLHIKIKITLDYKIKLLLLFGDIWHNIITMLKVALSSIQ